MTLEEQTTKQKIIYLFTSPSRENPKILIDEFLLTLKYTKYSERYNNSFQLLQTYQEEYV